MSAFQQALNQGYSVEDVLAYFAKAVPQSSSMIKKALKAGHPAQQILGFLNKSFDNEDRTGLSESERHGVNRRSDSERAKQGLKVAGSALVLPVAGIAARSALSRSLPSSIQNMLPGVANQAVQNATPSASPASLALAPMPPQSPQTNQLIPPSSQPPAIPNVQPILPQSPSVVQPQGNAINLGQILNKYQGVKQKIDEMKGAGNNAEAISGYFKQFNPSGTKKLEAETGTSIDEIVTQYLAESPSVEPNVKPALHSEIPEQRKPLNREEALGKFRDKLINEHLNPEAVNPVNEIQAQEPEIIEPEIQKEDEPKEPAKIEAGSTVSSPEGVGEIKAIRNGKAIIEVDGKKHQVNEEDLEGPPIPEKDLAQLFDDLIGGIESETGEDVSRMVQWAGYNPKNNTLTFLPYSGKLYKYADISEEDAALLTDILSVRKTTGSNFIGAWKANSKSPIGAALSKLIRRLQTERGGKGNEYEETHEPIYSAIEPAVEAKKRKKKKK